MKPIVIIPIAFILFNLASCSNKPSKKQAHDYLCNYLTDVAQIQFALDSLRYDNVEFMRYLHKPGNWDSTEKSKAIIGEILKNYDIYLNRYSKALSSWQNVALPKDKTELRERTFLALSNLETFQKNDFRSLMIAARDSLGQLNNNRLAQIGSKLQEVTAQVNAAMSLQQDFCIDFEIDSAEYAGLVNSCKGAK